MISLMNLVLAHLVVNVTLNDFSDESGSSSPGRQGDAE